MKKNRNTHAFSLLELLMVIGIIFILALLSVGVTQSVRKRAKTVLTHSTFSCIQQGLMMYREVQGAFPRINTDIKYNPSSSINELYKLVDLLTQPLAIEDKNFKPPIIIKSIPASLNREDLREDGMIAAINGHDFFVDGWGNIILYYYGSISVSTNKYPYPIIIPSLKDANQYSINNVKAKAQLFDLISPGPDGNPQTTEDNITNF
jgi:type II secretory pathway pseudopilin PulG